MLFIYSKVMQACFMITPTHKETPTCCNTLVNYSIGMTGHTHTLAAIYSLLAGPHDII